MQTSIIKSLTRRWQRIVNEELKIIISAVTAEAEKGLKNVNKELNGMKGSGGKASGSMGKLAGAAKVAAVGVAAAAAAVVAMGAALVKVADSTADYRKSMAQLTSAFQANGSSAQQASKTYGELFRFMGETDTAVEAANLLSKLTTNEKDLAEWTKTLQGVYATFPDSLPIEALAESANETARVGKVTGNLADALNWAGVSEDAFNQQLAQTTTLAEREALIRTTLSGLYGDAAELYEKNASAILAQNEAQHRLNESLAKAGAAAQPLKTALTSLSATLLEALAPAINAIVPYLVAFINAISKAVSWVSAFITALTGKKQAVEVTQGIATGMQSAASGAQALAGSYGAATKAAEKLKRTTAGFDELNVMSSGESASAAPSAPATGGGGGAVGAGIGNIDIGSGMSKSLEKTGADVDKFAAKVKKAFEGIKSKVSGWAQLFTPAFNAWKAGFTELQPVFSESFASIGATFTSFWEETLAPFSGYLLEDFIPTIVNSFSENLAPVFTDVLGFAVKQFAADFQWACEQVGVITEDILQPALEHIKMVTTDTFAAIGDEWAKSGETLTKKFEGFINSIKQIWETFYNSTLKPVWDVIKKALDDIWKEHLEPLWRNLLSFFSKLGECIMTIWNNFLAPIVNWLIDFLAPIVINAVDSIMKVVKQVIGTVSSIVSGILKALGGLLDFITGVFSGDWKKAWEGIKTFFKGIWDAIVAVVKAPINLIITAINALMSGITTAINAVIKALNKLSFKVPDWVPGIGGKKWGFDIKELKAPSIPLLATGGIVTGDTLARIGEGGKKEAVLPLEQNTGWMDTLADRIASRQGSPSKIVLMLDGKELGYAAINSINNITRQTGELKLAIV